MPVSPFMLSPSKHDGAQTSFDRLRTNGRVVSDGKLPGAHKQKSPEAAIMRPPGFPLFRGT